MKSTPTDLHDRVLTFLQFCEHYKGLPLMICTGMIKEFGFYTFTDTEGRKTLVIK